MTGPLTASQAQAVHDQRKAADPGHDRAGCWCCCADCGFDYDDVAGRSPQ